MSDSYENPLCKRYASPQMRFIFSDDNKFSIWRTLWIALAEAERELGLGISEEQIDEMRRHVSKINYDSAERYESKTRHDVMAHILAFGDQCPLAKPIIHLGATSCYVGDNADIIIMRQALLLVKRLLVNTMLSVCDFAEKYKDMATLAYTHFQAAQPTTVGKRASVWLQDLLLDFERVEAAISGLKLLGCKGTTGTGASFFALFDGDRERVKKLEELICKKMDFCGAFPVSGQTYTRKADYFVLSVLSGIAQSACKFSNDIRLLSHLKEVDEPFEDEQIGSSAMAYKRNPMRSERIAALARYLMVDCQNAAFTAANQWLERTLDDSANRRISLPEAFLAADGILSLYINIISGLTVYPKVIERHMREELPFMLTENILMHGVKKGGDRQVLHEAIRRYSVEAGRDIKLNGADNSLLERIVSDPQFCINKDEIDSMAAGLTGMAREQTEEFVAEVRKVLKRNEELWGIEVRINV